MVATVKSTKAKKGEASTSASQPTALQGLILRNAPIKTETLIPNMPTTVEDMLSEVHEEKPTLAEAEDSDDLTSPSQPMALPGLRRRKTAIKTKNMPPSMEDMLSEVSEEEPALTKAEDSDDSTSPSQPMASLGLRRRKTLIEAKTPIPNVPTTIENMLSEVSEEEPALTKAEDSEDSTSTSQASQGLRRRNTAIKSKNMPPSMEDMLAEEEPSLSEAEEDEDSTSTSHSVASQGSILRKDPIKAKTPIPNVPTTVEDMLSEEELSLAEAEDSEDSTSTSQPATSQGSILLRNAPIKAKTPPTTVEIVLSEVPEEKLTLAKDDKTFPTISTSPLPVEQTIILIRRILSISKNLLYYGVLALVAICVLGVLLTVVQSIICTPRVLQRNLPFCEVKIDPSSHVEFDKLVGLQARLEEAQEASAGGVTLPTLMERGEIAVREVALSLELSNIPSKNDIIQKLGEFREKTTIASDDLRDFNLNLDRAMDSIIFTNQWTARTLREIAREEEIENSRGTIAAFINKGLALIEGSKPSTDEAVKLQYLRHISQVQDYIEVLIVEARHSVLNFNELETSLWGVNTIGKEDLQVISKSKTEASKKIATMLGLNCEEMEDLEEQSKLVLELLEQKDVALARVTGTLSHLKDISAGLRNLRARFAISGQPQAQKVPLLVQIDTVQRGIERLERVREMTRQKKDHLMGVIRYQFRR